MTKPYMFQTPCRRIVSHLHLGISPDMPNYLKLNSEVLSPRKISVSKLEFMKPTSKNLSFLEESNKLPPPVSNLDNAISYIDKELRRQKVTTPILMKCRMKNIMEARSRIRQNNTQIYEPSQNVIRVRKISPYSISFSLIWLII